MQPTLHTHPQSGNAHEHKSTKALAARLVSQQYCSCHFSFQVKRCWVLSLLGLILAGALAETRG